MKLAVSNIAWPADQDAAVAGVLKSLGVRGIEVAPTKLFPQPLDVTPADIDAVRHFWGAHGIEIVAAQSLLFGRPELTLFESEEKRRETHAYLSDIIQLCAKLGAEALVFGSPKNRRRGDVPHDEAFRTAVEFFDDLADIAQAEDTCLVFEANPPHYGADFCTSAADAISLVSEVNHPGYRLHLDTACMTLAGDPLPETFAAWPLLRHFHISAPNLDPPSPTDGVDHAAFAKQLRKHRPAGWVSLEMRTVSPFSLEAFAETITFVKETYRP
jgi:D-psicose/D-tagatose/L-ribulose 3-epimerase